MDEVVQIIKCGNCGQVLDEWTNLKVGERKPCPTCGSASRRFGVAIEGTQSFKTKFGRKARRGGKGRPFYEAVTGDDLHRKTGIWYYRDWIVDRARDWYKEVITDPRTGETIHKCEEPLSEHKGHGSAKHSKTKNTEQ